jgi:hypothetical protein
MAVVTMSYYFEIDGKTVWNPSLRVGLHYLASIQSLSKLEKLDAGMTVTPSDETYFETGQFSEFVAKLLLDYFESGHPVWRLQVEAVLLPALVMLERAGHPVNMRAAFEAARFSPPTARLELVEAMVADLAGSMAN